MVHGSQSYRRASNEGGFSLVLVVAGMLGILLMCATAIDLGVGFVARARLNKAVDAAALIAVKYSPQGTGAMTAAANATGQSNMATGTFTSTVASDANDVTVVRVEGHAPMPTVFGRVAGVANINVGSAAEVTRYPVDLTLVLDVSRSMVRSNSFGKMRAAAETFINLFDPAHDQVGVVYFGTTAAEAYSIQKDFLPGASQAVADLTPYIETNMMGGIRLGHDQLLSAPPRGDGHGIRKVVMVLFTDGRPDAFTATMGPFSQPGCPGTPPATYFGTIAAWSRNRIRAFTEPDPIGNERRILCFDTPGGVPVLTTTTVVRPPPDSPMPAQLPNGDVVDGDHVRAYATALALAEASATRADGAHVYTIGLGNPADPTQAPDEDLLRQIANENGIADASQPRGQEYFAADNTGLPYVFEQVAVRILTRVTL